MPTMKARTFLLSKLKEKLRHEEFVQPRPDLLLDGDMVIEEGQ